MQLDRLSVKLRLRNPWEAMDLGFAMVHRWAQPVYGAWLAVFLPLCAAALLLLPRAWAILLIWWLKPALDRIVLHVVSSGVFGDLPGVGSTLRALRRAITPGLLATLFWLRLSPARSFNLPVWQLERQRGGPARDRRRQLQRRAGGDAVWLTVVCSGFELALGLSLLALYDVFVPRAQDAGFDLFTLLRGGHGETVSAALALVYCGVVTVIEPAYVAAGFALYLNRRTALEGWDLEVELRRIGSQRLSLPEARSKSSAPDGMRVRSPAALLAAAGIVLLLAATPQPAMAQPQEPAPQAAAGNHRAAAEIREILKRPELDEYREQTVLRRIAKDEPRAGRNLDLSAFAWILDLLARAVSLLVWIGLGLAVAFVVALLLRHFGWIRAGQGSSARPPPDTLFGLDVRPESLPEDIAGAARQYALQGDLARALSLLYRGALLRLLHRDGVELVSGDTEDDCLRKSRTRLSAPAIAYFARLLAAWRTIAYAGRTVGQEEVESLCTGWASHFGTP